MLLGAREVLLGSW